MGTRDPRVDAYIAKSADFAKPILTQIREIVHSACPETEETLKWSSPFFMYHGGMMCHMAAFKAHVALGFWKGALVVEGEKDGSRGEFGRLESVKDLPSKKELTGYIKKAMALNDAGVPVVRKKPGTKPELPVPAELTAALAKNKKARAAFDAFPPGQRREYSDWIAEAKRAETKAKRVEQAVEWIAEGKTRNWKYER